MKNESDTLVELFIVQQMVKFSSYQFAVTMAGPRFFSVGRTRIALFDCNLERVCNSEGL